MADVVIASRTELPRFDMAAQIRNEPVQARSTARLAALLDAAAHVVDEIGYERLTTAMVAERAGASIGTVYRYFPDRIAVLQSLAARNVERTGERVLAELGDRRHTHWAAALSAALDVLNEAFRHEPGFAALRYGDVLDLRPFVVVPAMRAMADSMFSVLIERHGMDSGDGARVALQSALTLSDAIAADAFQRDPNGDKAVLQHGATATTAILAGYFPASSR
ncbi:MAG: TetR family transcriptional regulator [Actinomycetota bacterium]|nr:TetR family transcriptional regulator [Actinomycetota bacterium]